MRGAVFLLFSLWAGVDAINPQILADVVQNMRRFGLENHQYAMAVRLTQQQCNDETAVFDVGVQPSEVQKKLKDDFVYLGERIIAAIPDTLHAEYHLLAHNNVYPSRVSALLGRADANECIVFFSNYSPCLDTCNHPGGQYSILPFLNVFNTWNANQKAFVFSSVWEPARHHPGIINPSKADVHESFKRINSYIPVYRCVRYAVKGKMQNECYACVTSNTDPEKNNCLYGYPKKV